MRERCGWLEVVLSVFTVLLGILHTWAGRYSITPDGISYLDVGSAFWKHNWVGAFNAYWSPLYAWIQGLALGMLNPSPQWEFPAAHVVNFAIFLLTFAAFRFLLRSCLAFRRSLRSIEEHEYLPAWTIVLIAYPVFWWASFELMPLYEVGPDLALSACIYLAAAFLLRARLIGSRRHYLLLGFVLGVGYWVKAPFFLLSFVFLALASLWQRGSVKWFKAMMLAGTAFLLTACPLVLALSLQKHRLTFGDSARLNYAWFVAPRTFHRNWQGDEPGSGIPLHPTHELSDDPPVYAFDGPVIGTYPPWLDPSYWNDGLRPHFAMRAQLQALATDLMTESSLIFRAQPALLLATIFLLVLGGRAALGTVREVWPLVAFAMAAFAMYAPVHVEPRFLGGFVALVFLMPLTVVRLRKNESRPCSYLAIVLFGVMAIGTLDTCYRFLTLRLAVPGTGPNSVFEHVTIANQLHDMGLVAGDRVAIIGDGSGAYWARLAKVRIVAEVMAANHDARRFWNSSEAVQSRVVREFAMTGAKVALANSPSTIPSSAWEHIAGTDWYLLHLVSAQ